MLRITGFSLILFSVVLHSLAYASSSRDSGSDPFLGSVNPYSVSTRGDEFGSLSDLNQDSLRYVLLVTGLLAILTLL